MEWKKVQSSLVTMECNVNQPQSSVCVLWPVDAARKVGRTSTDGIQTTKWWKEYRWYSESFTSSSNLQTNSAIRKYFMCGRKTKIARGRRTKIASALTKNSRLEKITPERINQNPKDLCSGCPAANSHNHHALIKTPAPLSSDLVRWESWRMKRVW